MRVHGNPFLLLNYLAFFLLLVKMNVYDLAFLLLLPLHCKLT